jgi:hypothetical protein
MSELVGYAAGRGKELYLSSGVPTLWLRWIRVNEKAMVGARILDSKVQSKADFTIMLANWRLRCQADVRWLAVLCAEKDETAHEAERCG